MPCVESGLTADRARDEMAVVARNEVPSRRGRVGGKGGTGADRATCVSGTGGDAPPGKWL